METVDGIDFQLDFDASPFDFGLEPSDDHGKWLDVPINRLYADSI